MTKILLLLFIFNNNLLVQIWSKYEPICCFRDFDIESVLPAVLWCPLYCCNCIGGGGARGAGPADDFFVDFSRRLPAKIKCEINCFYATEFVWRKHENTYFEYWKRFVVGSTWPFLYLRHHPSDHFCYDNRRRN